MLALIGARLYLKFAIQRKRLEASDYFIFFSWICALAGTSGDIFMLILKVPDDTLATFENYVPSSPEHFELIFKVSFDRPHDQAQILSWCAYVRLLLCPKLTFYRCTVPLRGCFPLVH